jgi:hypothetical protein
VAPELPITSMFDRDMFHTFEDDVY